MPKPRKTAPAVGENPEMSQVSQPVKNEIPKMPAKQKSQGEETKKIDNYIDKEIRENEIEEGLSEIYQGDDGKMVDVKTMEIKKGRGWIYKVMVSLLSLAAIAAIIWTGYYYYKLRQAKDSSNINLSITADQNIDAGKEFYYTIDYKNLDQIDLKNLTVKLTYPENFIFMESSPMPNQDNNVWKIDYLQSKRSGQIKVKGRLIGTSGQDAIILGSMTYTPTNFSSEFSKDASYNTKINNLGIDFNFDNPTSVLVGDEADIAVKYQAKPENFLDNFRLTVEPADNIEFSKRVEADAKPGIWEVKQITDQANQIDIKFNFKDKLTDTQNVVLDLEYTPDGQKYYPFFKKEISFNVMKKNLNLNLIINGSNKDQGVNFGQTLNYSIMYSNKGEADMKDIVVMAILDGDFLDWKSFADKSNGKIKGNKITWSKQQISDLADLAPNAEGTIDFSINVMQPKDIDPTKNYQISSYARFSVGDATSTESNPNDNKSNLIINKINSDLTFKEQIRYFNDDNIAVGTGPQPPKVGETTSYKVYWDISNSLNELNNLKIETVLPAYVTYESGKNHADMGSLQYDSNSRKVTWIIDRLPITAYKAGAEFSISVKPTESDQDKILLLLPETKANALDSATQSQISKAIKSKTTKLEDDPAITDDGIVK